MRFDLVVIGGGTAGTTAAVTASSMGRKAAVVEKDTLGGT
jgi:pyruvate/2-oxoglutarate dehydrogenase complex dihydrolipoamide dehydrogenase (E3) component